MSARIKIIPPEQAEGKMAELYNKLGQNMANILRVHSLNPDTLESHLKLYRSIMLASSPLSRIDREMIATVVSAVNSCHY